MANAVTQEIIPKSSTSSAGQIVAKKPNVVDKAITTLTNALAQNHLQPLKVNSNPHYTCTRVCTNGKVHLDLWEHATTR